MRQFPVPMDLLEEEKLVGGFLSLRQLAWLCAPLPAIGACWVVLKLFHAPLWVHGLCDALIAAIGCSMAFARVAGMNVDRYLRLYVLFYRRNRIWVLKRT